MESFTFACADVQKLLKTGFILLESLIFGPYSIRHMAELYPLFIPLPDVLCYCICIRSFQWSTLPNSNNFSCHLKVNFTHHNTKLICLECFTSPDLSLSSLKLSTLQQQSNLVGRTFPTNSEGYPKITWLVADLVLLAGDAIMNSVTITAQSTFCFPSVDHCTCVDYTCTGMLLCGLDCTVRIIFSWYWPQNISSIK